MPSKYNLRKLKSRTTWVKDETLKSDPESEASSEDEDYEPDIDEEEEEEQEEEEDEEEEEEDVPVIKLPKGSTVSVKLHIHTNVDSKTKLVMEDSESESEPESEEEEDEFISHLMKKYVDGSNHGTGRRKQREPESPSIELNEDEEEYYGDLSKSKRRKLNEQMKRISGLVNEGDIPFKFRVLELPIPDSLKASVIKKIDILNEMDGSEGYKLRSWVESFLRIPFGKMVTLPVKLSDGPEPCAKFLSNTRDMLDKAVYGMPMAKTQIMQTLAQWISSPGSLGNVIALKGPPGVGKTSIAKNGVAQVLQRPFEFFSLGGSSDAANFVGHSFTYEGSMCGRIADALITSRCMNPVMYFDELDKVSTTAHGDEIVSMLIHLTDRSQNSQFHDRYFAGVDFDLSQCLFVFSFNDESKVHPILRDRMQVITCSGYNAEDKKNILTKYIWPQILERVQLTSQLTLTDEAVKFLIEDFSKEEEGVRNLIRSVESLVTRINLLRIADENTAKEYVFYKKITLPCTIDVDTARHILKDTTTGINESWRHLYT
uniref:ATPase AAA-type core domain-containing protein n=1 Tax=viral metagenome TaxID=1070528 RepID=A0A6C0ELB9_9ZZZZ